MGRVRFTIYHSRFTRLRTYPQHTLSLLPLLRSRPGGVHKTSIVRSPKSDMPLEHRRLRITKLPIRELTISAALRDRVFLPCRVADVSALLPHGSLRNREKTELCFPT